MSNQPEWPTAPERLALIRFGWLPPEQATQLLGAANFVNSEIRRGAVHVSPQSADFLSKTLQNINP